MTDTAVAAYVRRPVNPYRLRALQTHAGSSVLDVGCGNGAYVSALQDGRTTFGLDWQPLPTWASMPGRFAVGLADQLPFSDDSFDTVSCFETLEHLADPQRGLAELGRVARRTVILTVPNCEISRGQRASGLVYHHWVDPTHRNFWSFEEFVDLVAAAGFRVVESARINEIDLRPLVAEAWTNHPVTARLVRGALKLKKQRRYAMTTLVVARPV